MLQWKPVKVTPLKVNNWFTSTAYVIPVFCALYFSNLNPDRLLLHLEKNKVICDNQIGFMKKERTSDHIFIINTIFC